MEILVGLLQQRETVTGVTKVALLACLLEPSVVLEGDQGENV